MNKLFGLFLLALAFLAPDLAQAAARFAVCTTTCTWDNTSTAMWSTTSGGATGASAPTSADDVTLDAATCVGGTTCTITTFAGTISILSLTQSACTASTAGCILDASANNTNFTISGGTCYSNTGAGTRTLNMGNGTWTCSNNGTFWNIVSSMTLNASGSTLAFTGTGGTIAKRFVGAGKTYNIITLSSSTSATKISGANTIGTLTVSSPNRVLFPGANTTTVTTFTNISASLSNPTALLVDDPLNGAATISSANNFTCDFCGISGMTFSGGGTFSATNSYNLQGNTGITITTPSAGGGGGRIIGG